MVCKMTTLAWFYYSFFKKNTEQSNVCKILEFDENELCSYDEFGDCFHCRHETHGKPVMHWALGLV
jgi:hypothetical protein